MKNYHVMVSDEGGVVSLFTSEDADEAEGYADFCRAEMKGARVWVEPVEYEPDDEPLEDLSDTFIYGLKEPKEEY